MKTVEILRSSTPECPKLGYGDHVMVYDDNKAIYGGHASSCPNPYLYDNGKLINWRRLYAMLAEQEMIFECRYHPEFRECLLLNNGGKCETINPNPNHDGQRIATGIFVHRGGINSKNPLWRGSRGCCTVPPNEADNFFSIFSIGEKGTLTIKQLMSEGK